jgi:hypothetical protein
MSEAVVIALRAYVNVCGPSAKLVCFATGAEWAALERLRGLAAGSGLETLEGF